MMPAYDVQGMKMLLLAEQDAVKIAGLERELAACQKSSQASAEALARCHTQLSDGGQKLREDLKEMELMLQRGELALGQCKAELAAAEKKRGLPFAFSDAFFYALVGPWGKLANPDDLDDTWLYSTAPHTRPTDVIRVSDQTVANQTPGLFLTLLETGSDYYTPSQCSPL
jgi:hypothetical protein